MSADQHHRSKKVSYDLLLVPRDDAGESRSLRFAPWQVYTLIVGSIVLIVAGVLLVLVYTPIGALLPIENPELENRYGRELVALNQRMTTLMEQLVELRQYNVKLRNALGEKVTATDSGLVVVGSAGTGASNKKKLDLIVQQESEIANRKFFRPPVSFSRQQAVAEEKQRVVFPVVMPTEGYLTRGFSPDQRHYGLDIAGKVGTLVSAAADGSVVFAGWTSDDGYKIILSHTGGFLTIYKHHQALLTSANAFVRRGESIGLLGKSGQTSAGPHLHFEIWKDGTPVNPANYILNLNF